MNQKPKSLKEVKSILNDISYKRDGWNISLIEKEGLNGWLIQVQFRDYDLSSNKEEKVLQKCRKWYISPYMTTSEIVSTCLLAYLRAEEHEARERFTYKNAQVFSPHFDMDELVKHISNIKFDSRK
jgi:hypothetical protein